MNPRRIGATWLLLGALATACSDDGSPASESIRDVTAPTASASPPTTQAPAPAPSTSAATTVETTTAPPNSLTYVDAEASVLSVVADRNDTTRFMQLTEALGDDQVFRQERGVTLLVPVDAAWDAYGADRFDALLADPTAIALLLSEHLSIGESPMDELLASGELSTAMARTLAVVETGGAITIGGATVIESDLTADNGVVHLIDSVIEP